MTSSSTPPPPPPPNPAMKRPLPDDVRLVKIRFVPQSQMNKIRVFEFKAHLPLRRLVDHYFVLASLDRGTVELLYNGNRLNLNRTPNELGMEGEVTIDVMMHSNGGGN